MKRFIISAIVFLSFAPLFAQDAENTVSIEDGALHISEVVQVPSLIFK